MPQAEGGLERGGESLEGGGETLERGGEFRGAVLPLETEVRSRGPGTVVWWATEAFWAMGFILPWAGAGGDLQSRV
jgi:hypothetical protein